MERLTRKKTHGGDLTRPMIVVQRMERLTDRIDNPERPATAGEEHTMTYDEVNVTNGQASTAYRPECQPHAADWIRTAARHARLPRYIRLFRDDFGDRASIGPCAIEVRQFLCGALGRIVEPYRGGWAVTHREADWLAMRPNEQSVTARTMIHRALRRPAA